MVKFQSKTAHEGMELVKLIGGCKFLHQINSSFVKVKVDLFGCHGKQHQRLMDILVLNGLINIREGR